MVKKFEYKKSSNWQVRGDWLLSKVRKTCIKLWKQRLRSESIDKFKEWTNQSKSRKVFKVN